MAAKKTAKKTTTKKITLRRETVRDLSPGIREVKGGVRVSPAPCGIQTRNTCEPTAC
jgi:hypothetical protein